MMEHWSLAVLVTSMLWVTSQTAPAQCHFNSQALCEYEGRNYTLGESWMEKGCVECTCLHPVGVGCCEMVHRPVDFPAWCEVRVEALTCTVRLVQTADPRLPCIADGNSLEPSHGSLDMKLGG